VHSGIGYRHQIPHFSAWL